MKKPKQKGTKIIIAAVVCAIALTFITRLWGVNPVSGIVRNIMVSLQTGFAHIGSKFTQTVEFIFEMNGYKEENERLVAENIELRKTQKDTESYREEIEELRNILDLQKSISTYPTTAASVIGYSTSAYFDKIEINRGSLSKIEVGDVVINSEGLVGTVSEVGMSHSIVSTIVSPDNSIGIKVTRTGDIGVVEGDEELCKKSLCKLAFVDKDVNIIEGDILETSGSGGVYPGGINLGIIRKINMDNLGMLSYAVVDSVVDFGNLYEVLVLDTTAN